MRILKYELIKIFRKKSIIIALIIFSVINIYKINYSFKNDHIINNEHKVGKEYSQGYWRAHDEIAGTITYDKINFIKNRYKNAMDIVSSGNYSKEPNQPNTYTGYIFGDMNMFKELYDGLDYYYNYEKRLNNVIAKAEENIDFYRERANLFEVKNNKKILSVYGKRSLSEFYDTTAYEEFFKYDFSSLLIILLLTFGLASVFSGERESSMNTILLTSKYGKNFTIATKILAAMMYVAIISIYFFILDFLCFSVIFKLLGYNLPIYSMRDFEYTPLNMEIWKFIIYSDTIKLFGFMVIGLLILLFSSIFSESLVSFIASIGMITGCLAINDFFHGKAREIIAFINPVSMLTNRELFKEYSVIDILGKPFFLSTLNIICVAVLFFITISMIVIINKKNASIYKIKLFFYLKVLRKEPVKV